MTDDFKKDLINFLRSELHIDVNTKSTYTGGLSSDSLYKDYREVIIYLADEVLIQFDID